MRFSDNELTRYQRQLLIEEWDQERLKSATVLVVGLGGLGGVAAIYLAAAGIGRLRLCDPDSVELSNLSRQILYSNADIGRPKAPVAQKKLLALNPDIEVEYTTIKITEKSVPGLVHDCDLIIDGLDNHQDRLILNQTGFDFKIPFIYGAIHGWQGQTSFIAPPETPCLSCIMPQVTESSRPIPVFGALPAVIGSIQATQAIRYILDGKIPLSGKLLIYHADSLEFESIAYHKDAHCGVCSR